MSPPHFARKSRTPQLAHLLLLHDGAIHQVRFTVIAFLLLQLGVPEAFDKVVIDHAHGLHEGVTNRAADELEATSLQVFAHGI